MTGTVRLASGMLMICFLCDDLLLSTHVLGRSLEFVAAKREKCPGDPAEA